MLYRKTTKAVSAAILTVMALLGVSAHAIIDLDATTAAGVGTITFSKETLGVIASGTAPANQFHGLHLDETGAVSACNAISSTSTSSMLAVKTKLGIRIASGATRYVRLDLTNMRFRKAIVDNSYTDFCTAGASGNPTTTLEAGGAVSDDFVVIGVTAGSTDLGVDQNVAFHLSDNLEIKTGATSGVFAYAAYADLGTAVGETNAVKTASKTGVLVRPSMTVRITEGSPAVANVAVNPRFTDFVGGGRKPLGSVMVSLNNNHLKAVTGGGTVAALADVQSRGWVALTAPGGLEFGTFTMHAGDDCSAAASGVSVAATGDNKGVGIAGVALGTRTLCVAQKKVDDDKDPNTPTVALEIPEVDIKAALNFLKVATAQFAPPNVAAQDIGSIERNGTTVRLPYLSTADGYNNRLIIVNRGSVAADYTLTFTTEDGTTATAGHMAEGMVAANSTMVIRVGDAVTLVGGSRTAATLAVVAPNTLVDVATTIVNLEDGSTDTVTYDTN